MGDFEMLLYIKKENNNKKKNSKELDKIQIPFSASKVLLKTINSQQTPDDVYACEAQSRATDTLQRILPEAIVTDIDGNISLCSHQQQGHPHAKPGSIATARQMGI